MKTFHIKAASEAGRWSYTGLFRCSIDAVIDAMNHGALYACAKPAKA